MTLARGNTGGLALAASPNSVAFDSGATSNPILIIATHCNAAFASGVTYNGVSATRIGDAVNSTPDYYLSLFYLINPATGSNTITGSVASGSVSLGYSIYSSAKQSGQPNSSNTLVVDTNSLTQSPATTVVASNCWLVGVGRFTAGTTSTGGHNISNLNQANFADSNGVVGTGSQSIAWSTDTTSTFAGVIASIAPAASTAIPGGSFLLNLI